MDSSRTIIRRIVAGVLLAAAVYFIVGFFASVVTRYDNVHNNGPYEESMVEMSWRIRNGQAPYQSASVRYIPTIYGPAFPYLAAVSMYVFGKSLLSARLITYIALILLLPVLFLLTRTILETTRRKVIHAAFVFSLGYFLAIYIASVLWLDLAKVDALFVLSLAVNAYLILRILLSPKADKYTLAFLILNTILFVFSKQSGMLFALTNVLLLLIYKRHVTALWYAAVTGVLFLGMLGLLESWEDGRFMLYSFVIPGKHPLSQTKSLPNGQLSTQAELLKIFWPQLLLIGLIAGRYIYHLIFNKAGEAGKKGLRAIPGAIFRITLDRKFFIIGSLLFTGFLISVVGRLKIGGIANSWLYFHLMTVLLLLWVIGVVTKEDESPTNSDGGEDRHPFRLSRLMKAALVILILLQFHLFFYNPVAQVKENLAHKAMGRAYVRSFCELEQPVMNLMNAYQSDLYCDSKGTFLWQSAIDIMVHEQEFKQLTDTLRESVHKVEYKTVIFPQKFDDALLKQAKLLLKTQAAMTRDVNEKRKLLRFLSAIEIWELFMSRYRVVEPKDYGPDEKIVMAVYPISVLLKPDPKKLRGK